MVRYGEIHPAPSLSKDDDLDDRLDNQSDARRDVPNVGQIRIAIHMAPLFRREPAPHILPHWTLEALKLTCVGELWWHQGGTSKIVSRMRAMIAL